MKERRRSVVGFKSFAKVTPVRTSFRSYADGTTARGEAWSTTDV
jgi:hypothetical protein